MKISGKREIFKEGKFESIYNIFLLTLLHGCEILVLNSNLKRRIKVLEMKDLRNISGVKRSNGIRNTRIREIFS